MELFAGRHIASGYQNKALNWHFNGTICKWQFFTGNWQ